VEIPAAAGPHSVHRIWIQTEQPPPANPGGTIIEAWYMAANGKLEVKDMNGKTLGIRPLRPGENAEALPRASTGLLSVELFATSETMRSPHLGGLRIPSEGSCEPSS
jgi:hypothetical protein